MHRVMRCKRGKVSLILLLNWQNGDTVGCDKLYLHNIIPRVTSKKLYKKIHSWTPQIPQNEIKDTNLDGVAYSIPRPYSVTSGDYIHIWSPSLTKKHHKVIHSCMIPFTVVHKNGIILVSI